MTAQVSGMKTVHTGRHTLTRRYGFNDDGSPAAAQS